MILRTNRSAGTPAPAAILHEAVHAIGVHCYTMAQLDA